MSSGLSSPVSPFPSVQIQILLNHKYMLINTNGLTEMRSWTMQCRISMYWYSSQQLSTVVSSGLCGPCHPAAGRPRLSHPGPLSLHHERCDDTPRERTSLSCSEADEMLSGSLRHLTVSAERERNLIRHRDPVWRERETGPLTIIFLLNSEHWLWRI